MLILKKGRVSTVRYLIKYTKGSEIKFVAHLDLMRTLQKIIKRSVLPIEYSKGFNPHMAVSIAQPLSVGVHSEGEYMDVVLNSELEEKYIMDKMNENTPRGIEILDVVKVIPVEGKKKAQAMAIIDAAKYTIKLKCTGGEDALKTLQSICSAGEWNIVKMSKSGEKMINIKPLVHKFEYEVDSSVICISALIACGSRANLSARLLADYLKENIESINKEAFVDIEREEMYAYKDDKLVTLSELFKN
ncbi:TIGR03936 family radical SAM-associated protein [Clostridium sp. CM028]|uniref:TIGR03936 family radical SAM-associated protein n=1 Tax=Clostridium TaxID=1485 RepID=UPI00165236E9|nr:MULTISPECIES: TIGR03936 family radical SAM-associated protein [Clostridium]MBW9144328.1 TIGR03936 family radical SAM-associated protein [Clostridium sp. CM027]MBW9149434.1 TIGR03936 family radical SAM-associated protein [Clostridium sp. CM028]MBZ9608538.1 TIGR03936 family radical SAM-associated protein [Clostridium estertheticum]UVE41039.1 TIGR03936 family radical SAM-associated protein [Clostridium sp. CM027]WLC61706.1 TIGR03936 family radical SAM-associated protein [Clostridium sp. CM028]